MIFQTVYIRLTGYEDTNDAERMYVDPTMRCIVGGRAGDSRAAWINRMMPFETQVPILQFIGQLRVSPNPGGSR